MSCVISIMLLILTTLPHFLSIIPIRNNRYYSLTIFLSTSCSILFHVVEESNSIITCIDYSLALLWFLYDLYFGFMYRRILSSILLLNISSFLLHYQIQNSSEYTLYHGIWHLINASKCFYISRLIREHAHYF